MGTIITVNNFATALSAYDPATTTLNHLYGLVDMGSNGIRFSISDLSPPRSRLLNCIYRERAGISLYDALHESIPGAKEFYFSKATIERVSETLGRFKTICDSYEVRKENISVFATEAMRTAKNREDMLVAINQTSGLTVDILSPEMESMFGAMGARSGFTQVDGLFMDLGGGSVQMTYVNSSLDENYGILAAQAAKSMPFGAAKLTVALSAQDTAQSAKTELRTSMKDTYEGLKQKFPKLKEQADSAEGVSIYFCGGGFRGYGSMLMHTDEIQPYPIPSIGGYKAPGSRFIKWREMLHVNNYEEGKIYGMSKRRREQFPAIVTVIQSLVEAIPKIKDVVFCSGGNREGVLFMKLPASIRELDPIPLLPSGGEELVTEILNGTRRKIFSAMPNNIPAIFSSQVLSYVCRNIWHDMGDPADANSAKALHNSISGSLAGLPGLTHELRASLSLILCTRWGTDLAPGDKRLHDNLQALIGQETSWWCQYIGILARLLATICPAIPKDAKTWDEIVNLQCSTGHGLGKKGKKIGIRLKIILAESVKGAIHTSELESMFEKVGKGLSLPWKVESEVMWVESK